MGVPRVARQHAPGVVTHVITRFVNGERVMDGVAGARPEYLDRLDAALDRSDWRLLWYCLMGTHVHLGMQSGEEPLEGWTRALNGGFAAWVNRRGRMLGWRSRGAIIADRPTTVMVPDSRAGYLAAYIHNNPVRAHVVGRAIDSEWSSHGAYVRGSGCPPSLNVARGLALCGCAPSPDGRRSFDAWVNACVAEPRNSELSGATVAHARTRLRHQSGSALEVATPYVDAVGVAQYPASTRCQPNLRVSARGSIGTLLDEVSSVLGLTHDQVFSSGRGRHLSMARRLAVLACRAGNRPLREVCEALRISDSAGSYLIRTANPSTIEAARAIAARWSKRA